MFLFFFKVNLDLAFADGDQVRVEELGVRGTFAFGYCLRSYRFFVLVVPQHFLNVSFSFRLLMCLVQTP